MSGELPVVQHDGKPDEFTGVFLSFFYYLRSRGLKVTPTQWLTLIEGLVKGLHGSSLIGFYSLARSILVNDESEMDEFDQAFAVHFKGVEEEVTAIEDAVWEWLKNPIPPYAVDPEWRKMLDKVDIDALRKQFEQRLNEQDEQHHGGNYWVGTGGTSAFGHSGYHPGGIRVGGERRNGSAVQVAAERRYKEHRRDVVIDTRQISLALKKLRALGRNGPGEELDVDGTIDKTAREAGELSLIFQPPRQNNLSLVLAMDVGGSMEPYRRMVDILFSAAYGARHFKRFEHIYFHNCVYDNVYRDALFNEPYPLHEFLHHFDKQTRLVLVGDAYMYQGELTDRYGAIYWEDRNEQPGGYYLSQLAQHFKHTAWLNPMDVSLWNMSPSLQIIRSIFPMYPLTVEGVHELAMDLAPGGLK
jgi:hypothetical protein